DGAASGLFSALSFSGSGAAVGAFRVAASTGMAAAVCSTAICAVAGCASIKRAANPVMTPNDLNCVFLFIVIATIIKVAFPAIIFYNKFRIRKRQPYFLD